MISENTQEFNDSIDSSPTESGNVDDQDTWLCCCVLLITELSKCLTAGAPWCWYASTTSAQAELHRAAGFNVISTLECGATPATPAAQR